MSRSHHPKKTRKKPRYRPACGWTCPICNPDIKLEWFREKRRASEKRDLGERVSDLE